MSAIQVRLFHLNIYNREDLIGMDDKVCKRKTFTCIEQLNEKEYVVERKKKQYLYIDFSSNIEEFDFFSFTSKRLKNTGIKIPKVYWIDKKNKSVVMQYIKEETVLDTLIKQDLTDEYYEQIFYIAWASRMEGFLLDFNPKNFVMHDSVLYYMAFKFEAYDKNRAFQQKDIYYWVYTKQLVEYLKQNNLPYDEKRLKDEYSTNKEIALKIVKFYR